MVIAGRVRGVFSAKEGFKGLPRPSVESLDIVKDYGIKGDKFAGKNRDRAVMLVGTKAYDIAKESGIELAGGSLGENILLDFDPHDYIDGTIFTINGVQLEITESCSLCKHIGVFDPRLPKLILNHRGLYCRVLKGGIVTSDQTVSL